MGEWGDGIFCQATVSKLILPVDQAFFRPCPDWHKFNFWHIQIGIRLFLCSEVRIGIGSDMEDIHFCTQILYRCPTRLTTWVSSVLPLYQVSPAQHSGFHPDLDRPGRHLILDGSSSAESQPQ